MENFDFAALLQNHEKKHKIKPAQFVSVAGGVRKRLEINNKRRRSSRLTIFDSIRNLSLTDTSTKQPEPFSKLEHRRMQLEKWKEEKEKKRQLAAASKKKPFVTGVPHNPLKFVPPPPPPKAIPSTSGRVTRSQTARNNAAKLKPEKFNTKKTKTQSFAPRNAIFKAPEIKNMDKVPALAPLATKRTNLETVTFDPVLPSTQKASSKSQAKLIKTNVTKKAINKVEEKSTRTTVTKAVIASSSQTQTRSKNRTPKKPVKDNENKISASNEHILKQVNTSKSVHSSSDERISPDTLKPKSMAKHSNKSVKKSFEDKILPVAQKHKRKNDTPKKVTQSSSEEVVISGLEPQLTKTSTPRKSLERNITTTPRNPIPKSESSSEEKLRSPKSPVDLPMASQQFTELSPFVTQARGKANARRETMQKRNEGLLDEDASDADSVVHFRRQLDSEIKRMTEMCDTWDKVSEQIVLPETVQELVLGAVGQARLLMSHKLQQFASLVQRCERPEPGRALVTPADLHGFWDMVFMQVENVDMRFKKLEELRARNWSEEVAVAPRRVAAPKAKPAARPASRPATSRLRDVIAAARRAKKQEETLESCTATETEPSEQARTFEGGFFSVRSPAKTATPVRTSRPSLLQSVLSSEAKKSANKNSVHRSSLAMLRASLLGKEVENDSPAPETPPRLAPIDLHATPSRSILKPANIPSNKKSGKKSIKVVLFEHSDTETHNTPHKEGCCTEASVEIQALEDVNTDSRVSSMDIEKDKEQKENKLYRKKYLQRQDAIEENSPMMTRSRRKSMQTTEDTIEKTPERSSRRKKALQEVEVNIVEEKEHKRKSSSRRKSSVLQ